MPAILDRQELFSRVARRIKRLVDFQVFCLMLWDEASERLEHAFSLRYDERISLIGEFPLGYGIVGTAAARCGGMPHRARDHEAGGVVSGTLRPTRLIFCRPRLW